MAHHLKVILEQGDFCSVVLSPELTLEEVKTSIKAKTGVDEAAQRIFLGDKELRSNDALASIAAQAGETEVELRQWSNEEVLLVMDLEMQPNDGVGRWLSQQSEEVKASRDLVLCALEMRGAALEHAAEALKRDRELVLAAINQDWQALKFAAQELQADRGIALAAIQRSGLALELTAQELRGDRALVLEAVRISGLALKFAPEELRGDREIVLAAVRAEGLALGFASKELMEDKEIVLAAKPGLGGLRPEDLGVCTDPEQILIRQQEERVRNCLHCKTCIIS